MAAFLLFEKDTVDGKAILRPTGINFSLGG